MRRPWLLPLAPLYWLATSVRNSMFDVGLLKSRSFDVPILCIGNLSAGGTGKTPHTEWVLEKLSEEYSIVVLSRGYGRKTKGFQLANSKSTASEIGDEPLQIARKFPHVKVVVCEDRVAGVEKILSAGKPDLILLDDAYQHRYVKAGMYWLLTPWFDLYTKDAIIPFGNLREDIRGADRAHLITVTKCPGTPSPQERKELAIELNPREDQVLGFSKMIYLPLVNPHNETVGKPSEAVVVTGIAEPAPLLKSLSDKGIKCTHVAFKDHRNFDDADVEKILKATNQLNQPVIITTRKDYMRWPESEALRSIPTYIQDIGIDLNGDEDIYLKTIRGFIENGSL